MANRKGDLETESSHPVQTKAARGIWEAMVDIIALPVARLLFALGVPANAVTAMSLFVVLLAAAIVLAIEGNVGMIIGAAVYQLGFVLDCIDGKLARARGGGGPVGQVLDLSVDRFGVAVYMAALVIRPGNLSPVLVFASMTWLGLLCVSTVHVLLRPDRAALITSQSKETRAGILKRLKLRLFPVGDVEAVMFAVFIGPLVGYLFEGIIVSCAMFLLRSIIEWYLYWRE